MVPFNHPTELNVDHIRFAFDPVDKALGLETGAASNLDEHYTR